MKILIPGGTGFLGGMLCRQLLSHPEQVTVATRRKQPPSVNFPEYQTVDFDLTSPNFGMDEADAFDAVVYLSGVSSSAALADPHATFEVNSFTPTRLMKYQHSLGCTHFIYASTSHVSDLLAGKIGGASVQDRSLRLYASSKLAGETLLENDNLESTLKLETIRLNNCFGPPDITFGSDTNGAMNDFCRQAVKTGEIVIKSSGDIVRTFTPASFVVDAICRSLFSLQELQSSFTIEDSSVTLTLSEAAQVVRNTVESLTQRKVNLVIQGKVSDVDESDRLVKSGQVPEKFVDEIAATVSHYLDI
jgi:nucleoside-diphosphate-sugar epimerase